MNLLLLPNVTLCYFVLFFFFFSFALFFSTVRLTFHHHRLTGQLLLLLFPLIVFFCDSKLPERWCWRVIEKEKNNNEENFLQTTNNCCFFGITSGTFAFKIFKKILLIKNKIFLLKLVLFRYNCNLRT
jgi:hypothetical protein